jgi:RNA polymerase sigma factor (sigma-70 family)
MTNEELAIKIKEGETSLIENLWLRVERFIKALSYKRFIKFEELCVKAGVAVDDIYQAGYFALLKAIEAYEPETGFNFITYMPLHLSNEFWTLLGRRTSKRNPLNASSALDAPMEITYKDGDSPTLLDNLADSSSEDAFEQVIEEEYRVSLRRALDNALDTLPENKAHSIRRQYFDGLSPKKIAEELNVSRGRFQTIQMDGLKTLRGRSELESYRNEIISRFALKGSIGKWKETGMSPQERIIIKFEEKGLL